MRDVYPMKTLRTALKMSPWSSSSLLLPLMVLDKFMSLCLFILLEPHDCTCMNVTGLGTQFLFLSKMYFLYHVPRAGWVASAQAESALLIVVAYFIAREFYTYFSHMYPLSPFCDIFCFHVILCDWIHHVFVALPAVLDKPALLIPWDKSENSPLGIIFPGHAWKACGLESFLNDGILYLYLNTWHDNLLRL